MFIELVDALRCVRPHELTWLVVSSSHMEHRDIVSGELGCPVCTARYPIERGIADFRNADLRDTESRDSRAAYVPPRYSGLPESELALRVAALLDLVEPGGFVVLAGEWTAAAYALGDIVERVHVLGLDPVAGVESGGGVSLALTSDQVPLRPDSARGIALDIAHAAPSYLASAADALRANGRLLAPVSAEIPRGLAELARDEHHWLAVKEAATGPVVKLKRSKSSTQ